MSYTKRYYEEHFDDLITYADLERSGLTEEAIYEQWECFSNKSWEEFKYKEK